MSLGLKYLVHRIENHDTYASASRDQQWGMYEAFLAHHQQGKAAEKNGEIRVVDLHTFLLNNPHLIRQIKTHRRKLHDVIREQTPWAIKTINGEEHVALTRGLDTETPSKDHSLASYADVLNTGFGEHMRHRWVPLKHVWYSYDAGNLSATSWEFGNENEFLVSPHEEKKAEASDITYPVPRSFHSYGKS